MKSLNEYLDDAKEITGSDRQTSIKIGVSAQHISKARAGGGFSPMNCCQLADLLKIDERLVIAAAYVDARKGKDKKFWERRWENVAGAVAGFIFTASLLNPNGVEARELNISKIMDAYSSSKLEIIRKYIRSIFQSIIPLFRGGIVIA